MVSLLGEPSAWLAAGVPATVIKAHRGHITKQGSSLVRWAAVESVARYHGGAPIAPAFMRIQARRGNMVTRVAAARKLLTLVFYGLRDGETRCLKKAA